MYAVTLMINVQKTIVKLISKTHGNYLNNTQLEKVHKFRYLGIALNDKWDSDKEIKTRRTGPERALKHPNLAYKMVRLVYPSVWS